MIATNTTKITQRPGNEMELTSMATIFEDLLPLDLSKVDLFSRHHNYKETSIR